MKFSISFLKGMFYSHENLFASAELNHFNFEYVLQIWLNMKISDICTGDNLEYNYGKSQLYTRKKFEPKHITSLHSVIRWKHSKLIK